jgi:hypothetical protein
VAKRERSPGLLKPLKGVSFKDAVRAFLNTPPADNVKGSRAVNLKARPKPRKKPARRKVR